MTAVMSRCSWPAIERRARILGEVGGSRRRRLALEQMDYGSLEFGIHDRDGYTLAFSEPSAG